MKTIRHSILETNSSSSHSLTIDNSTANELLTSIPLNDEGNIILNGGEFGWEWEKYTDALTKANYCAVDNFANEDRKNMLVEVLKEQTGAKDIIFDFSILDFKAKNNSYIDHQSEGTSNDAFKSKETLRNFIFNRRSKLYTGNDNDECPPNFYDDDNKVYNYEISLDGTPDTFKVSFDESTNREFMTDVLRNLFTRNDFNEYNSRRGWYCGADHDKLFSWPHYRTRKDYEHIKDVVDFENHTITVVNEEPVYEDKGEREFVGYKLNDKKVLKYHVNEIKK